MVGLARLVRRLPQPFDFLPDRGTTSSPHISSVFPVPYGAMAFLLV
jgi:hypothetical protein